MTTPAIIIASGATYKHLGVPGEDKLTGRGVSFCATCDGALYRDQEIAMVGGGDNALTEILFLERFAKKIHLIHRRDQFRGCKSLQERVMALPKVQIHWDTVVTEFQGQDELKAVELKNVKTSRDHHAPGGRGLHRHRHGSQHRLAQRPRYPGSMGFHPYRMRSWQPISRASLPPGDVRSKLERQISTAVGDGTIATIAVERYLEGIK